ncbi:MAG: YraN family protein [Ruminococcus sp.]|nr:YraN family protein [Ruminococcus sp.]
MNTRSIGTEQEESACRYLEECGVRIKERNFRCRQGEIDLIGQDDGYLVFFEVKYRKDMARGSAAEAVGLPKQRKICKVADYYRMVHKCPADTAIRFDVVAIDDKHIEWIRNAFAYCGRQ